MKVYTKKGDKGQTSLIGGTRVPKSSLRIEAYGTVDELNSYIGLIRDAFTESYTVDVLKEVQDRLFTIGAALASDPEKSKMAIPDLLEADVEFLEQTIDKMEASLPALKSFVLPGGHITASYAHIARCVCRRGERIAVDLSQNEFVADNILAYLNRLSDYLFVLSRYIIIKQGAEEISWEPRL